MSKINEHTEAQIKAAASIVDVLEDQGVVLKQRGANLVGLCPFHDDRSLGSFVVSKAKNMCSCYSCGVQGAGPVDVLMMTEFKHLTEKEAYPKALRYLAAMYNIYVDQEEAPVVVQKPPRPPAELLKPIMWPATIMIPYFNYNDSNPLLTYLRKLPLSEYDRARLDTAIHNYRIGTYPGNTRHHELEGNTIWWYIDQMNNVRTGKLMPYKTDGHRDKTGSTTWVHTLMAEVGKFDPNKEATDICLFGQHLMNHFKEATIRVVESEKTAVICSAFTDMKSVLWIATGGLSRLNSRLLEPFMKQGRTIELYPDIDGYEKWEEQVHKDKGLSEYKHLVISQRVKQLWNPEDGEKADIADIMIRIVTGSQKTIADDVKARLGLEHISQPLQDCIDKFKLEIS